jgi:hypothetical protein
MKNCNFSSTSCVPSGHVTHLLHAGFVSAGVTGTVLLLYIKYVVSFKKHFACSQVF